MYYSADYIYTSTQDTAKLKIGSCKFPKQILVEAENEEKRGWFVPFSSCRLSIADSGKKYICSNCGETILCPFDDWKQPKYCPECGAKVVE